MLLGSFVPGNETSTLSFTAWSFYSRERKCVGTKRPGTDCTSVVSIKLPVGTNISADETSSDDVARQ